MRLRYLRVRWSSVVKGAGACLAMLAVVVALPDLLRPAPPEPLAPDVGLPRTRMAATTREDRKSRPRARIGRAHAVVEAPRPTIAPAPRHRRRQAPPRSELDASAPSVPAPEPAGIPAPVPAPAAVQPQPPAGDGSEEFAPH